ncbi:MAG: glycosyltransferase family 39 protein [Lentisphaeraceae bacterium]|nr:glycosyltransferase family 39 protein [Lentisphaeraceae bacterium]
MYTENELNHSWKWLLGTVSALLLLPQLAMKELTKSEALYGLMARNANENGNIFSTVAGGQPVNEGHLYPWIVNFFGMFGVNEFTIRLPSIMGLAIMIFIAAYITYKYAGRQSAIVAGTCMLSSYAAVLMGTRGEENMLGAAFLSLGWVLWFEISRNKKEWFKAWLLSLITVSISAFCLGYYVFILFYLPLFFLKKPTDVRKRVFHLPHFKALGLIILTHFIIYIFVINLGASSNTQIELGLTLRQTDDYTSGLFSFPFTAALYLLPWTFFSWPAYCAAFEPMEKDPVLFHYYRTIAFCLFIVYWIIPESNPLSLLPVLVPIAIMTGLHYQILVRRHHIPIRKLIRFIFVCLAALNIGLLIFFGIKITGVLSIDAINNVNISSNWIWINISISTLSILFSLFILAKGKLYPVWIKIMSMVVLGHWVIIAINSLPDSGRLSPKEIGSTLSKQIPEDASIINFTDDPNLPIMFYVNRKVKRFTKKFNTETDQLPEIMYVISTEERPAAITTDQSYYKWTRLSEPVLGKKGIFQSWKGVKQIP